MEEKEIFRVMENKENVKNFKESPLTKEELERQSNLINKEIFFVNKPISVKTFKWMPSKQKDGTVDLRGRDTSVKSQDNGKCTAFAGVAALENMFNKVSPNTGLDLSEWDAWSYYQKYSCEAFIEALQSNKVCDEKQFPQYKKKTDACKNNGYVGLKEVDNLESDIDSVVKALDNGNVVYAAISTPKDMLRCDKVVSASSAITDGGHAVLVVGYYRKNNKLVFIIKNSWGTKCHDQGYVYVPADICNRKEMYCYFWEIKQVFTGKANTCVKWERIWWKPWSKKCVSYN